MKAFVINLDHATDRWGNLQQEASDLGFDVHRVSAVFGDQLSAPFPDYSPKKYRRRHGKSTNVREIGCYLSHLKAIEAFLDTKDEFGLILEDDVGFHSDSASLIQQAIECRQPWDVLRLSGLHSGTPLTIAELANGFSLAVNITRQTGAGAYVVNRRAAEALCSGLRPMSLPYDHAFDREWLLGIRSLSMTPYPITQNERYSTSIVHTPKCGLGRYLTVFPYRAANESCRVVHRAAQYVMARVRLRKSA
jgi:glycosyl transferase family 25